MKGGTVIFYKELENKIQVDFITDQYKEKGTVFLEKVSAAKCIQEDDSIFTNGEYAYWSPKGRYFRDYKLNVVSEKKSVNEVDKKKVNGRV